MIIDTKTSQWQEIAYKVAHIIDGVGCPIDKGIQEMVIALQVCGINTLASCEGHLDHGVAAPWVDIGAPDTRQLTKQAFIKQQAVEQARNAPLEERRRLNAEAEEAKLVIKRLHLVERQKVASYLDRFYAERLVSYDCRLILNQTVWSGVVRLESQGSWCQDCLPLEERSQKLLEYQQEMQTFTAFLKRCYFEGSAEKGVQMQYTTIEAAKMLELNPRTIRSHIERGTIAAEKRGRDHLISQEEIARFQAMRRSAGRPPVAK